MTSTTQNQKPTHRLYAVKGEGKDSIWTRIGSAWPNRDSKGFSFQLDALPWMGRVVMREITERDDAAQK